MVELGAVDPVNLEAFRPLSLHFAARTAVDIAWHSLSWLCGTCYSAANGVLSSWCCSDLPLTAQLAVRGNCIFDSVFICAHSADSSTLSWTIGLRLSEILNKRALAVTQSHRSRYDSLRFSAETPLGAVFNYLKTPSPCFSKDLIPILSNA